MVWWDEVTCIECGENIEPDEFEPGDPLPEVCGQCRWADVLWYVVYDRDPELLPEPVDEVAPF